jgi:DNA-binding transcriptional MerR regulator
MAKHKYYRTSDVAKAVSVHPNTVRLYEALGLLQPVRRDRNGYRHYSPLHIEQMRLAILALRFGFVEGNIRKRAISVVKTSADGNSELALSEAYNYLAHIQKERSKAEEALEILKKWMSEEETATENITIGRKQAAGILEVSIDTLRNWERNGLLNVPRNGKNGYRIYGQKEIERAKVIRTLRAANFTIMAILKMLKAIDDRFEESEIIDIVSSAHPDEDMTYTTDRWILTLSDTEKNAKELIQQLIQMITMK